MVIASECERSGINTSAPLAIPASFYDSVYSRRRRHSILDHLDAIAIGDAEMAEYRLPVSVTRADLNRYVRLCQRSVSPGVGPTILDHGCGFGGVGQWIASYCSGRCVGLDHSHQACLGARRGPRGRHPSVTGYVCADFARMPFATGSVDAAFSLDALYLAGDPELAMRELHRVVKIGGVVVFTLLSSTLNPTLLPAAKPEFWEGILGQEGFEVSSIVEGSSEWRSRMARKHRLRWEHRAEVTEELAEEGWAELAVTAALLGLDGTRSVLNGTRRFEFTCVNAKGQ